MQIDIEKLNRKTPYPEPSEDFFKQMQANVISQTIEKNPVVVKKEAKVFSLNFKWMAAAAVVLIAGITAFLGFNNDPEVSMAKQSVIVDSVYKVDQPIQENVPNLMAENNTVEETQNEVLKPKVSTLAVASSKNKVSADRNMADTQTYAVESKSKSSLDVEKVLAAFTPDQLKDLDKNSEQDVYLDLYN
ncbi:hypothetical protein [Epilithonimonas xixisoli]|uniref:Uncharacterized protein n=1 Tax=Epilithonimonas xixisoli TaxID=1476462 RepID=A0A4R8I5V2_9FLAO|nr:hypothetical protein [Epilithonimonas xixisoli]TDX84307.1 hypothetical protein B0I22_1919 [Epilithonimonas xixisoli]